VLVYHAGSISTGGSGPVTCGGLNVSGNGSIKLTAASSGTYAGIASFQGLVNIAADL